MIIDRLENAYKYYCLGSEIEKTLKFLASCEASRLPLGRHELGNGSYVSIAEYASKRPEDSLPEYHEKYTDVQCVLSGAECIGFAVESPAAESENFDSAKDIGFVKAAVDFISLTEGMFAIIFPKELHQPGISAAADGENVRKAVGKIFFY